MGLSNYLPSSRISQAGVVADTANRPASPYEGQVLYQKDTNQLLVYDGSAWVMLGDTDEPPGLQLVKTQTVGSAVTSQAVTGAFSSSYRHYKISISGVTVSVNAQFRLTFGATTTGYYYGNPLANMTTGAYDYNKGSNVAFIDIGAVRSDVENDFLFDVLSPYQTTETKVQGFGYTNSADFGGMGNGMLYNNTSYTDFTITASSGTMTGGTIRVYGYRE